MSRFSRSVIGVFGWLFSLGFTLLIIGSIVGLLLFNHYSKGLPDYSALEKYDPPTVTRLYAADGRLLAEYATEKRVFVPLKAVPKRVVQAFLSAEDKNFYAHTGIDFTGIARAVRDNVRYYGQGKSLVGGSTITQQVVKNFLLTNEKSIERKIKEAILALRISQVYSKDKILELYLNQIYLGLGSYGVAAAAQNYFNKSLDELTLDEAALLAAQPKAPTLYNPKKDYEAAKARRDWILENMYKNQFITLDEWHEAQKAPITLRNRDAAEIAPAEFFAEEVRRTIKGMYGDKGLYEGGLVVKTTLDPQMQKAADTALRKALVDYDRRRGYRGPIKHLPYIGAKSFDWKEQLARLAQEHVYHVFDGQKLAMVTALDDKKAQIIFEDESRGIVPFTLLKWTRKVIADGQIGPEVKKPGDILRLGDVVLVGIPAEEQRKSLPPGEQKIAWDLQQIPEVNGAIVVLDPHTGRVLAMSGGYAYGGTEFNRATQAKRQPGSAFKPFVYLAGLENGYTPSTMILDAPVELSQGAGQPMWKPQNYKDDYLGPTTMRVGLEKSRNTMTVRIAQTIGIQKAMEIGKRFGIYDNVPRNFSIVLGAAETTLLKIANAYGMIVNGGKAITPSIIERIDDRHGKTIFRRDSRVCAQCVLENVDALAPDALPPIPEDTRAQIADPRVAYQITSILQGVATRGTAARAKEIGKIVAGKTGTTNDSNDTWFVGFTPDLVAGVFVGYDKPRTLGKKETGGSVALPAFISFMKETLADKQNTPFRVPSGIQFIKVDLHSGQPVDGLEGSDTAMIEEAFITGRPIYIPGVSKAYEPPTAADTSAPPVVEIPDNEVSIEPADGEPVTPNLPAFPGIQQTPPVVGTGGLY
jgi:penicillin-binding protein 1A